MKILQINSTVNTGSVGRIAEEIGQLFIRAGHDSYMAYSDLGTYGSQLKLLKIGNKADVYLHGIKTRLLDRHGFGSKYVTQKLIQKIIEINPDAIGLHNIHGYYINVEVLFNYLKKAGKPVIWTLFDCWPFTGHCSYYDFAQCERWKTGCYNCPEKRMYPASWVMDNSKSNYARKNEIFNGVKNLIIVTHSNWLANQVNQSFLSDYPVSIINNGVNLDVFKPINSDRVKKKYGIENKKLILGVANYWSRRKGLKDFIELNKHLPSDYQLLLVGLAKEQQKTLPRNIIGISRTESVEELTALYSAADVFVNPTLQDNFPTTNIEALACGTPVITYNTGGSPEAVDAFTGCVIEKGDISGLLLAIENIVTKGKEHYGPLCRKRAEMLFNKDDRYQDYIKLYEHLLV